MALSGTLETFSLPDVLRLLASTKKTGLLALEGDRGAGRIWVDEGGIVAASADRAVVDEVDAVLFELLRHTEASFDFEPGAAPLNPVSDAVAIDDALATAEERLAEWQDIEAVVPSLDVWVRMVPERDAEVIVAPDEWRVLARVGTGVRAHRLASALEQGEFDVCRQLRDLIEAGLVELDEAPGDADVAPEVLATAEHETDDTVHADHLDDEEEPGFAEPALSTHEVSSLGADLASFVAGGTSAEPGDLHTDHSDHSDHSEDPEDPGLDDASPFVTMDDVADEPVSDEMDASDDADDTDDTDAVAEVDAADEADEADEADDSADFLSQLSHLSPKAVAAIEATSSADERGEDEVLADADGATRTGDEDIDQNLLLRFLSSAKQ